MVMGSSSTPNLSFIGIVDFSQEARWIYMTESVTDLLGYEPRDLVGRPSLELVHPDEFPRVKQLHYDTIRQDKAAVLVYLRMKHKDPLKGYVLCGVSRTVVHDVLVGSVSFANPNKALQNASTAQEITVIAPEARNFLFCRWHDPSPMPPSPIPEPMRVLPAAFLKELENYGNRVSAGGGMEMGRNGGGATIEYVDIPDRRYEYAPSPPRSPSPPPAPQQSRYVTPPYAAGPSYRSPPRASAYDRDDGGYYRDNDYDRDYEYTRSSATPTTAHITSQESYARRRSPSYPPSPASPVYTPQSPSVDSRRRLSGSSSSSSGSSSGSSRLVRSGTNGSNGAHGTNGVGAVAEDDAGSGRRLGHSTSWTRRRLGSATPTPGTDRDKDRDGYRDTNMDRDLQDERRRERERDMARELEEEERRYRARDRYLTPEARDRERDTRDSRDDSDLAPNRYYSPVSPSSSTPTLNGVDGHNDARGHSGVNGRYATERRSLTPSPPLSAYHRANAPSSPTYASVARGSPPRRHPVPPSPRLLQQPLSPAAAAPPAPAPRVARPREPSPVITFDHLPAQSSRTAFILDRFTDKSSIMYCSNTLLICPASPSAGSPSLTASSPTAVTGQGQRRSGSPPGYHHNRGQNGNGNANANANGNDDLAQANAIGRPFFDFVAPRDEQIVRDWIACVKGWGVNEKGQPSDGGFGFGRFGLVKEGRESAPRNPDPAPTSRGGRKRHGSTSGRGRPTAATRRGIDQSGRRRPGGNNGTSASTLNAGGSSPPGAHGGDSDPEREMQRQRQREAEVTVIQVDAIFSAHSDGLMVILRRAA